MRICEGADLTDGMLDVVFFHPMTKPDLVRTFPKLFNGTHTTQRVVVSTLEHLADDVAAAGLRAPVATVIGDVVRLRDSLRWFDTEEQP